VNIRAIVLALPVAAGLVAGSASASPVSLSPLGAAPHAQVATVGGSSCAAAATPAQMTESYVEYPTIAKLQGLEGVAFVGVSLSADGKVTRAWPVRSTGNRLLDRAAIQTALRSKYVPEQAQCHPVGGDYQIEVDFSLDH
jgi:periplasmic protein TonB